MFSIALVQDGTEVARQRFADVAGSFERCRHLLERDRFSTVRITSFTAGELSELLRSTSLAKWNCIVFASNALLSGTISDAIEASQTQIRNYLRNGGGIVLLHQMFATDDRPPLPDDLGPVVIARNNGEAPTTVIADDESDVLLRYPLPVRWTALRDFDEKDYSSARVHEPTELPQLFYTSFAEDTFPGRLKPVLRASDQRILLARSVDYSEGRVVLCTMPLDWQQRRHGQEEATVALLVNALRYAAAGIPRRLVWYEPMSTNNELLIRWLASDGDAEIHAAPQGSEFDETDSWLLAHVDMFALHPDRLVDVQRRPVVANFLARGGAVVSPQVDNQLNVSRVVTLLGRFRERELASRLYAELRSIEGWRVCTSAFDLRNIVAALSFFWSEPVHREDQAAIAPHSLRFLRSEIVTRLGENIHRQDLGSSIALAEALAHLDGPMPVPHEILHWLEDEARHRTFDIVLQIRAALVLARRTEDVDFLGTVADSLRERIDGLVSVAPVVRVLDAIAALNDGGLLGTDRVAETADLICDALDSFETAADGVWLSFEATAAVVRGLVALHQRVAVSHQDVAARLGAHVATGATALRRALPTYTRGRKGVAWLARVTHAIVVADRQFPIGLELLASIEWPGSPTESTMINRALLQDLATKNEELRVAQQATLQELEQARLEQTPARVGRAVVTTGAVALVVATFWEVMIRIGWASVGGLVANLAIVMTLMATILSLVFGVLRRANLLASPAERARLWIEARAAPFLSQAGKLKRG